MAAKAIAATRAIPIPAVMYSLFLYSFIPCVHSLRRFDKFSEQWVRHEGPSQEFRMELGAEKERVRTARQFGYFHESAVGRLARKYKTALFKLFYVFRIDLIAVAMALFDGGRRLRQFLALEIRIGFLGYSALAKLSRIETQSHGAAVIPLCYLLFLVGHDVYDRMR